jgi:undecaprenyl diphosphate synthase
MVMRTPLSGSAAEAAETAPRAAGAVVPAHVAIIMDGNGRWASRRALPKVAGHRAGVEAVRRTIRCAMEAGVGWLTLYAFSSENWRRPAGEVSDLTGLLRHFLRNEVAELDQAGVRLRVIGDRARFDRDIQVELEAAERRTAGNAKLTLVAAARAVAEAALAGRLDPAALTEEGFAGLLSTTGVPDPDLIIRTSGEQRLSNFLLWQSAYAELVFLDVLWPDFAAAHFDEALAEFNRRERRFGARPG